MSKIEAGCLAFIVKPYFEESRDRIVKVVRKYSNQETVGGRTWRCQSEICEWVVEGRITVGTWGTFSAAVIGEEALRRIDDPGLEVRDTRDILIPEHLREGETA